MDIAQHQYYYYNNDVSLFKVIASSFLQIHERIHPYYYAHSRCEEGLHTLFLQTMFAKLNSRNHMSI